MAYVMPERPKRAAGALRRGRWSVVGAFIALVSVTGCASSAPPSRTASPSVPSTVSSSPTTSSAGPASAGCAAHPDYLCVVAGSGSQGTPIPGPATASPLDVPLGLAVGRTADLYISDRDNDVIDMVTRSGTLSVVAGTGVQGAPRPGPATASPLDHPAGLATDASGDLYVADSGSNMIVRMTPSGTLSIVAGSGVEGTPIPGPAMASPLDDPMDVAVDSAGNLYIADQDNGMVERVTPSGMLSIVAGPGPSTGHLWHPCGVAVDANDDLYIADSMNMVIKKLTPSGTLSVFAGSGAEGTPEPGPATASPLEGPCGVAVDSSGNLYLADEGNDAVEKVTPDGTLSIVAGSLVEGTPIPGPVGASPLDYPMSVAVDNSSGDLYIGCYWRFTSSGTVVTLTPP